MIKAKKEDRNIVIDILSQAFRDDLYFKWLLEPSSNQQKFRILIEYVVDETFNKGEIYLSDEKSAVALWVSEKPEKQIINKLLRNISFFFKVGWKSTTRILKAGDKTSVFYPKKKPYRLLYFIAVRPGQQGKGLANTLINPMLSEMGKKNIPVYLETASEKNVMIYKKRGFETYQTLNISGHTLFLMRREP